MVNGQEVIVTELTDGVPEMVHVDGQLIVAKCHMTCRNREDAGGTAGWCKAFRPVGTNPAGAHIMTCADWA